MSRGNSRILQHMRELPDNAQRMREQAQLDSLVASGRCPIEMLPVPNLALVCRCLGSADLLAVYKSSRTLQAAASHPLTFQHGNRFSVDPWREGVTTEGPSAVVRSKGGLLAALKSRRFASFRLLTLRDAHKNRPEEMLQLLAAATAGTAPVLHALTVRWVESECDLSRAWSVETRLSEAPAFAYLRVLSISCPLLTSFAMDAASNLPPRLELLQLQPRNSGRSVLLPPGLPALLAPLAHFRQLVVRDATFNLASAPKMTAFAERVADAATHPLNTHWADLVTLAAIEAAAPQIDSIVWMIEVGYNEIVGAMRVFSKEHPAAPWPKLTRVRTLQLKRVAVLNESDLAPNPLLLFPSLTELRYTHQALSQAAASRCQTLMLDQLCAAQLSSLTHLTLTEAGPSPFDRQRGWIVAHGLDLAPLLRTLPHLISLSLTRLRIDSLSAFRFAPKLQTLHELFWPVPHDLVKADEMAACFPSLTELSARALGMSPEGGMRRQSRLRYTALDAFDLRPVLCAMPRLLRVSINAAPMERPDAIRSPAEQEAIKLQKMHERAQWATDTNLDADADAGTLQQEQAARSAVRLAEQQARWSNEPASRLTPSAAQASTHSSAAEAMTKTSGADPAATLLFTFAAGAGVKFAGSAGTDTAASANPFIFTPPTSLAAPADAAPAFSFGPAAAAAEPNPFAAPFSFAPVAVAPGGPSIAADPAPLSFAPWTAAAASSSAAAPTFSFAPAAFASTPTAVPAASPAPWFAAPASSSAIAFSAAPSAFDAAAPSAAVNPFSSPFVFAAPAGSAFAVAAPAGLPDLAGFNPFAAAPSSASSSSASASFCSPSRR